MTFTATVGVTSPGAGTPTGTVTFKDGTTILGTGTLSTAGGVTTATFTTAQLCRRTHSITAVYAGDTDDLTSTSAALIIQGRAGRHDGRLDASPAAAASASR